MQAALPEQVVLRYSRDVVQQPVFLGLLLRISVEDTASVTAAALPFGDSDRQQQRASQSWCD